MCKIGYTQTDEFWSKLKNATTFTKQKDLILSEGGKLLNSTPEELPLVSSYAYQLSVQHGDPELLAASFSCAGLYLSNQGMVDTANYCHKQAVNILREETPTHLLAIEYNLLSINSYKKGDYSGYLAYNDSSQWVTDYIGDVSYKALLLSNRSYMLLELDKHDEALNSLYDAQKIASDASNHGLLSSIDLNIAYVYDDLGLLDSVLTYLYLAIDEAKISESDKVIAATYVQVAEMYRRKEKYDLAIIKLHEAREIFVKLNDVNRFLETDLRLSKTYFASGEYINASTLIDSVIASSKVYGLNIILMEALNEKYRQTEELGRYDEALRNFKAFKQLKDSLDGLETKREVSALEVRYQTREKQKQLEILKKDQQIQKSKTDMLYLILTAIFLGSILIFFLLRNRYIARTKLAIAEKQRLEMLVEQNKLQENYLKSELNLKSKKLTTKALFLSERNEFLDEIYKQLATYNALNSSEKNTLIRQLKSKIKSNLNDGLEWKEFRTYFEETDPKFLEQLRQSEFDLTEKEMRLLALTKLGLSMKEIAHLMHVATNSVKISRYRLKKKLKLEEDQRLEDFVNQK